MKFQSVAWSTRSYFHQGVRHFYWNESWQCAEERTGTSTAADRQYVWHPYYIDALAISYNSSGTAHYYVQDGNFNVTAAMDSSGAVVERYSYTPYGECIVLNADFTLDSSSGGDGLSDISNEFTYTGRRLDVETGLYQYRHRYYHAQLGRFLNRDPIGYVGSEWNLFECVKSNPIKLVDPTGNYSVLSIPELDDYVKSLADWGIFFGGRARAQFCFPTPIFPAVSICVFIEASFPTPQLCGDQKICIQGSFSIGGGVYATPTVSPGISWDPPDFG